MRRDISYAKFTTQNAKNLITLKSSSGLSVFPDFPDLKKWPYHQT